MGIWKNIKDGLLEVLSFIIPMLIAVAIRAYVYSTHKYLPDIDTYRFLSDIRAGVPGYSLLTIAGQYLGQNYTIQLLMVISILTVGLFYVLCRRYVGRLSSFVAALFFSFSPLVFFNNQFGLIDNNVMTLFVIILIMIVMSLKGWLRMVLLVPSLLLFWFIWEGFYAMAILICFYYLIKIFRTKITWRIILGVFVFLLAIIVLLYFGLSNFIYLFEVNQYVFTSELQPIWNVGIIFSEYILVIFIWLLIFTEIRLNKKNIEWLTKHSFLILGFIIFFIYFVMMFRMNIFFIPFLYLWFAITLQDFEYKWLYKGIALFFIALFIIGTSMNIYLRDTVMDDGIKEAMDYVNTLPSNCLIGVWGNGYIYDYYTDKEVRYKGSSYNYQEQLDYLVYGNKTDCSIIFSNRDIKALEYMLNVNKVNISREEFYIVKTISGDKTYTYKNRTYYVKDKGE